MWRAWSSAFLKSSSSLSVRDAASSASKVGLEKHNRDFGQTFGKWGIASGPYFVFPFLGPSNIRDGVGTLIYASLDPVWANHIPTRNVAYSLRAVNGRADLLSASSAVEDAALDKYAFVRDAYVQRRQSLIDDAENKARPRAEVDGDQPPASRTAAAASAVTALPPVAVWFDDANQRAATPAAPAARKPVTAARLASLNPSN